MSGLVIRQNLVISDSVSHFSQLWSNHNVCLQSNKLTDLLLSPDSGPPVHVHLAVFLPLSPLLQQMANHPRMRGEDPLVLLPGISQSSVMSLVSLLYTGSCTQMEATTCQDILKLAESLGVSLDSTRLEIINQERKINYKIEKNIYDQTNETEVPVLENETQIRQVSGSNIIPCIKKPRKTRSGRLVKKLKDSVGRSPSQAFKYFCKSCSYRSRTEENLIKHNKISHDNQGRITCELCTFSDVSFIAVQRHFRKVHEKTGKKIKCKVCGWRATTSRKLSIHMQAVHYDQKTQLVVETEGQNNNNGGEELIRYLKLAREKSKRSTRDNKDLNKSNTVPTDDNREVRYNEIIKQEVDSKIHDPELESMVKCEEYSEGSHLIRTPVKSGATPAKSDETTTKSDATPVKPGGTPVKSGVRIHWDKEQEVPLMLSWFAENNSPSSEKLVEYADIINKLANRVANGWPVTTANLSAWFTNKKSSVNKKSKIKN